MFIHLHFNLHKKIGVAAKESGIKYENAKQIKKVYLREGRLMKKLYKDYNFGNERSSEIKTIRPAEFSEKLPKMDSVLKKRVFREFSPESCPEDFLVKFNFEVYGR